MIPSVNLFTSVMQKPEMTNANGPDPQGGKQPVGPRLSIQREAVFSLLKQLAIDNEVYFRQYGPTVFTARVADICEEISKSTDIIKDLVKHLQEIAPNYDYDAATPGNGFRSLICTCDLVLLRLISVLRTCSESRGQMMFRLTHYCKEIESLGAVIRFLILAFHQVMSMLSMLDNDSLFPPLDSEYQQYNKILKGIESLDASCFYGRLFGSQSGTAAFGSLIHSGKLLLNPEQRAAHIIKVTREADIEFCRGFWNLSEIPVPNLFCPSMAVCEVRDIPPSGPMPLRTKEGSTVLIHEPAAHTGVRPVRMKILSLHHRAGLSPENVSNKLPLASQLVIHCHGGGYVATSSRSHETYLRSWAKSLKCPLVSIDYSLAPENPFPRPTEEVLYAYAWILNNPEKVGWTGGKVCMVGDSAGGNLIVSVNLKLAELNVERMPDGLVPIYTPFLFQYLPSPSRVLSFMDPLLHMGVVIRCAAAYTGSYSDEELDKDCAYHEPASTPRAHKSLQEYVDQVQKAQREKLFDFSQGSQSIVSLINLSQTKSPYPPRQQQPQKKAVESSTPREQNIGASMESSRQTTAGETGDVTMESEAGGVDVEREEEGGDDEESNNTVQTVNVDGDPLHICLSATNADPGLIDYLQMHPLTKCASGAAVASLNEVAHEQSHDCAFLHSTPIHPVMEAPFKIGSASGAQMPSPIPMQLDSGATERDRLTLSSGSAPSQASKTKLTKSTGRSLSQSLAEVAAGVAGHAYDNVSDWFDAPKTPVGQGDKQKLTRATTLSTLQAAKVQQEEAEEMESHFTELLKLKLPRDAFMSPLYAPNSLLKKLPPIRFVACHLDPLLDDTIMFAKRMRNAGGMVASLDLLDSLPHGFLNFAPMSSDCREGANVCLKRIRETLR